MRGRPIQGMKDAGPDIGRAMRAAIVAIPLIVAEVEYLLADRQEQLRLRSAQAFEHLQRLLAVDVDIRKKWLDALDGKGETSCEQLGAVHLFGHGIYAFKAHASAGRTDLVFNEPVDVDRVGRVSSGLVLTEWKVAKRDADVGVAFAEAKKQAESYAVGVLAGLELAGYRYLVVVTKMQPPTMAVPAPTEIGGVIYQPITIAIEPRSPSKQSKKK